jgi:hypothetical protein
VAYNGLLPDQPNLGEEEKERGLRLGAPVRVTLDDLPDNALPSQPTGGGVGDAPTSELTLKDIPRDVLPENWEQRVLDVNHRQSQNTTPDRAAEITRASELTGADPGVLERNPALVEDSFQRQSMDALAKNSPAVATYLQNLENYKVSKDDLEALSATERVLARRWGALKSGAKVAGRFFPTAGSMALNALGLISGAFDAAAGLVERIPGMTPRGELPFVGNLTGHKPVFAGMRDELYGLAETTEKFWLEKDFLNLPEDLRRKRLIDHPELLFNKEWMVFTIGEGINSLGAMLLAAYVTGGGYGVAAIFGGGAEGGAMHRELLSKRKASEEDAINYSMLYAGASAWLNSLGIEAIFGRKAARNVAERFAKSLVAGGAEGLTEYAEEPTQAFLSGLAEDDTPKELIDRVAESLKNVEMFVAGAGAGGTMSYLNQSYEMSEARRQQEQKDFFTALNEAAASSKTRERLPAAYARAVQEIQKKHGGVVDTVYIDAELFQEVVMSDEQRADLSESIGIPVEQLSERIATGAKIPVPIDLFAANVAGTDRAPLISPYLSFSEEGLSSQQAAIIREGLDDELRRQIDLINIQAESENQFDIERNQVYEDMQARLAPAVAAGRMSKGEADQAALLWAAHAATFATSYPSFGMSPMQVHRSMNPDVQADSWADRIAKANRAAGEEAFQNYLKSPEFKAWFGNSAAVDEKGNPLILKHGTNTGGYTTFDTDGVGKTDGTGAFFTTSHFNAKTYTETDRLIDTPTPEEALANLEDYGLYIEEGEDSQGVYYTAYDDYGNSYSADTELEAVEGVLLEGSESQEGIYEVFLSIQNPLIVEANGANWDSIGETWVVYDAVAKELDWFGSQEEAEEEADRLIEEYLSDPEEYPDFDPETDIEVELDEFSGQTTDEIAREAREEGYDGVIFRDIYDNGPYGGGSNSTDVYVVFDPTQVKSATYNVGTFDPKNPDIRYQQDEDRGRRYRSFFSDVTSGKSDKYIPDLTNYEPVMPMPPNVADFQDERYKYRGHFDEHIMTSIPSFDEIQAAVGQALVDSYPMGARMLDIGASEGSTIKAIGSRSGGRITGIALDPNQAMERTFNSRGQVPGIVYDRSAFGSPAEAGQVLWPEPEIDEKGDDIPGTEVLVRGFDSQGEKFDIVHESMAFQFIGNDRATHLDNVMPLLAPDGIAIFEEKFIQDEDVQAENEAKKDAWKMNFYSEEQLSTKDREILRRKIKEGEEAAVGMQSDQVRADFMEAELKKRFKNVVQYWDSGNFRGYVASNDLGKVKEFVRNLGVRKHEFETRSVPRVVEDLVLPEGLKKWLNWEPEVTSTGNIKGAPPWVKTRKDHNAMRRQIAKFAREGLISRYWYEQSAQRILDLVQGEVEAAEKIFRLIAIYSPQADVDTNMNYALQAWKQFKEGVPREAFKVRKEIEDQKAIAVLYDSIPFSGRKTSSFYLNLMQPLLEADPSIRERLGYTEEDIKALNLPVTVDIWMARAFGYDNEKPGNDKGDGAYSFMESEIRRAAARMSAPGDIWLPHQVQAAVWTAVKARYEEPETRMAFIQEAAKKGFLVEGSKDRLTAGRVPGLSREQEIEYMAIRRKHAMKLTSARVEALAAENHFDFASAIGRRTWSAAVEAVPSVVLGAEIAEASPGVKREFTEESKELLLGPNGEDLLAEQLGVPFALVQTGRGAYEGEVNPNFLAHLVPVKRNGIFQRDEARAYARAVQYIYRQEAVPIMRADPRAVATQAGKKAAMFRVIGPNGRTVPGSVVAMLKAAQEIAESKGEGYRVQGGPYSRGVEITFSQDISDLQSEAVLSSLEEFLGDNGLGFTQVTPDTLAIVNFRGDEDGIPFMMDDEAFIRQLDAFIRDRGDELGITDAKSLWYEGEYGKVHDWAKDPQGEEIIDTGGITERPGLSAWIRDKRAEAEAIVEKYSGERLAAMESAQRGERFQQAVEEEPAGTELPVGKDGRVGLIHWSSVPGLTELDPARHGTGIKGAESKRKKNDPKNWVDRTYFGVEGGGYSREPFLGSNQYRTSVLPGRLYDFSADPDGLMARAKEEAQGNPFIEVLSVYERLIRDARYDGYYTNNPSMGTVAAVFYPTEVVKVEQGPDRLERFSSETNQEGAFVPKGSFQPRTDGTSLISLFETADASTFLHETGHAFFRFMEQMAALPEAPPELIRDWQILKEAVGYQEGRGPLSEAQDETLARMWERYFLQGEAPSLKLRTVFQRFGDWLKAIYRNIRLMNTPVSAEVEGVFKRMLATESEIAEAQDYAGMKEPFFVEADLISEENKKYREARKRAKAEAEERRYRKYVKAFLQAMGGKKKLKKDIENQLSASPLYSAIDEVIALGGFNLEMVDALIGSEARRELTKKYRGLVKSKGTIIPEEVAEDKGYASVHDLLKMMVEEPKKKIKVEEILNAEFERLKKDIPPANEDIHSDASLSVLLAELQILNSKRRSLAGLEAARQVQFEITAVREVARKVLAEKPLGEAIGHYPYSQAELRAARRARKAYLEGDLELAEQMKRRQLLNHALVLEAINARRDYDAAMKRIKKAAKRDMDEAYMHQLQGLLFKFGIYNNPPPEGTVSFAAFMEGLSNIDPDDPATLTVPIWSSWMFNEDKVPRGERQTYKTTLTYEDFKELNDAIVWLSGRGVDIKKGRLAAYAENLKELTEELIQPATNLKDRKVYRKGTWLRRLSDEARAYIADHEMLTFILDMMDGFTNAGPKGFFGPNRKKIGNVLADRQSKRDRMTRDAADVLKPLFKQLSESMAKYPRFLNTSVPVPELIKRDGDAWTFEKVLAVALNMGNATNLKRLEDGLGIDLEAALELTSILTKEDWDAIQKIWDHVNSYWPELNEVHYRINHFHQKKVEAQEIEVRTADGGTVVLKGGYYPIKYDGNLAKKVDEWTEKDDLLQASVWGHPGVKAGMTKERVATVKLPLALNLTVLFGHLEDTIHYITHADVIRDLDRVTQSSDYQRVMEDKFGQQIYRMIRPTLRHIARPERIIGLMMDKHMTRLRALSTAYVLGLNFSVAAKQVYSVPGAINDLGIGAYLRGIAQVLKHPIQGRRTMHEMSPYMETRSKSFDRDIRDGIGNLRPKGLGLKAGTLDQLRDFSFVLIRMMDFVAVYPTWWGAYKKSMAQQSDPEVAVRYADEIIRQSQPSAKPMDMSAMQRDQRGLTRAFSMFMTFVAKYGNRQRYYWRGWRAGQISNADYFRHVLLEAIAPPMLMNLMFAALWGNEPDEEDILIDMLVYQFSGYLLVREFAGMGGAFLKKYGLEKDGVFVPGLADSPAFEGLRIVQRSSGAIAAWLGDMEDDDKYGKAVWAFADLASFWVGVPAPKVAQKLLEGVRQFEEEDGTLPAILIPDPNKRQ